jgi:hypothetical protein
LIPGTGLPLGDQSRQPEGRGQILAAPGRDPVSMFERIKNQDEIAPGELGYLMAAVRAFDNRARRLKVVYDSTAKQTDATTGNVLIPLFIAPAGTECHVTQILADAPSSSTIQPSAPAANASSFAYVAIGPDSSGDANANADRYRQGLATFWPNPASSSGPILPVQATFNEANAPVMFGGEMLSYVLHGGSIAAFQSLTVQVTYRVEIWGYEQGQLPGAVGGV